MNMTTDFLKTASIASQETLNEMRNKNEAQLHLLQAFKAVGIPVDATDEFKRLLEVVENRHEILKSFN